MIRIHLKARARTAAWWVFAFGALAVVVSAGPEGILDRLSGKLMKSLAKELGTKVAPTDAELFAAALDDGSNAGEGDQFIGRLPASAIRAEGGSVGTLVLHSLGNCASDTTPRIDNVSAPSPYQMYVRVHKCLPCRLTTIHSQIEANDRRAIVLTLPSSMSFAALVML
jgi:hypothetical protein